jgi:hypothetical protein
MFVASACVCLLPAGPTVAGKAEVGGEVVAQDGAGSTYYVSPAGLNSNPGSREAPWATPGYGSRQLTPGDTLVILGGRYPLSIYDDDIIKPASGTTGAWITIKGEAGNRPVLAGSGNLFSAVDISGLSYIRIENLEITSDNGALFRTGIAGSGGAVNHAVLKDLYIHHIDEGGMDFADIYDLQVLDCRITYCGFGSMGGPTGPSGWRNVLVSGCELSYSGHYYQGGPGPGPYDRPDGFGIEPSSGPIEIAYTRAEHNRGDGLDSKARNTRIHHCVVANNRCDGVKLWGDGSKVENTLIYGTGDGSGGASPWAGVVIGTDGDPGARFEIVNVTLHDNPTRQAYPIYVQYDSATPISLLLRNTIISNGYGLAYFGDSVTLEADHNIFYRPGEPAQVYANGREYTASQLESGELGDGILSRDPLFQSPAWGTQGDYHLQAGSPAIDAGTFLAAPLDDLAGAPRPYGKAWDMGAYEWSAGGSGPGLAQVFYFAEGYTGDGFREYICLGNPANSVAHCTVTYLFPAGGSQEEELEVAAGSRCTINVNASIGDGREVSALVESDMPIAAERPMYFTYKGVWTGGHDAVGARSPSTTWYFAEGYTGPGFEEWLCVMNPGDTAAGLEFRFQTQEKGEVIKTGYAVPPRSRASFPVNDILGEGYQASLELRSDTPVVAERPMYFDYTGPGGKHWQGGHCAAGAVSLSTRHHFAEGTTRNGFEEWLTIQNPNAVDITVNASYQMGTGQGESVDGGYAVPAGSRITVFVPLETGNGKDVSVLLSSTLPFLAERPMYFDYHHGDIVAQGGHCAMGIPLPSMQWFFAEGYTGAGFDEWLCLQNPASTDALVRVAYFTQETGMLPARELTVPAGSRVNVMVDDDAGTGYQLSCGIEVVSGPGIVAERPVYFSSPGGGGGSI